VIQPESYLVVLICIILRMLCWGSWANTAKLRPGYRFQLFYWDNTRGLFLASIAWGMTLGTLGGSGRTFLDDLLHAPANQLLPAFAGGIIFNVATLLLVTAIDIAGLAVAFPVGIGIALVVGEVSSYAITPAGNSWMLFGVVALVLGAIAFDPMACHLREKERRSASMRGVVLSLGAGILMGTFHPLVAKSMAGENAPGPYAISLIFALGVIACSPPMNYLLMQEPLDGGPRLSMAKFTTAPSPRRWHLWGILGGAISCTGAVLNFALARGAAPLDAIQFATAAAAISVTRHGALPSMPTQVEVESFLSVQQELAL
jgi:glucose uptake protein